jgi:hypothetical protein
MGNNMGQVAENTGVIESFGNNYFVANTSIFGSLPQGTRQ